MACPLNLSANAVRTLGTLGGGGGSGGFGGTPLFVGTAAHFKDEGGAVLYVVVAEPGLVPDFTIEGGTLDVLVLAAAVLGHDVQLLA